MSSKAWKRTILGTTFILISIIYTSMLSIYGKVSWNLIFDIQRINSLNNIIVSPTNFNFWGHNGSQVNLFVPWVTSIIFWPLFQIGSPLLGYLLSFGLITLMTMLSAYYFIFKLSDDTLQSFIFAMIYTLSLTRLNLVLSGKLSDYLLMIFMPLVFYGLFRMLEGFFSDWPLYTLGTVLIALTSPWMSIAIMIVSLILIILAAVYRETHSWKYWKNMTITMLESVVLTIISTLGYTIPLIQRNEFFQASFKPMIQLSNFNLSNYYGGTQNLYLIYGAVALLLAVVVLWIPRSYLIYKLTAFGIMVSGIFSTDLVPWKLFKHFDFSKITFYFWVIFSFLICLLISYLLTQLTENKSPLLKLIVLLLATIISCIVFYVNFPKQAGNVSNDTISSNNSMIVHYPKKSFAHQDNLKDFLVDGKLERVSYTTTSNFFEFKYYNSKSSTIDVPVIYSHGLNVQINNEDVKSTNSDRGTVEIKSQPGANIVQLRYQYSTLAKVAMGLSLLGWLLLLWVIINKGKWSIGKLINNS